MTPYKLQILIHITTCGGDFTEIPSTLRDTTLMEFERLDVIIKCDTNDHGYSVTDLGRAWLASILRTKIPTMKYFDEHSNPIKF